MHAGKDERIGTANISLAKAREQGSDSIQVCSRLMMNLVMHG